MDHQNLQVLPLHRHPEYLRACCELINDEWPRSETARMMSLQASCDELPTSLVLADKDRCILGHCKLTPIPSKPESCFVETVVINKSMRGKGLGSYLMKYVEEYCQNILRLKMIHLSTKGQEDFYTKLGYTICAPVSIYGVRVPSRFQPTIRDKVENSTVTSIRSGNQNEAGPPPPPPPPMPSNDTNKTESRIQSSKTFMFKYL